MFTLLGFRPQHFFFVMTISTISMRQNCSISVSGAPARGCPGPGVPPNKTHIWATSRIIMTCRVLTDRKESMLNTFSCTAWPTLLSRSQELRQLRQHGGEHGELMQGYFFQAPPWHPRPETVATYHPPAFKSTSVEKTICEVEF